MRQTIALFLFSMMASAASASRTITVFFINDLPLLGIEHHTVQAIARQVGKDLVGLLGAFGHYGLVHVEKQAVDIQDGHLVATATATKDDRSGNKQKKYYEKGFSLHFRGKSKQKRLSFCLFWAKMKNSTV